MSEQLAKWREEFEKALPIGERHRLPSQGYANFRIEFEWRGYLRAKQEDEQAIKDTRKQALEDVVSILTMWANSHSKNEIIEGLLK